MLYRIFVNVPVSIIEFKLPCIFQQFFKGSFSGNTTDALQVFETVIVLKSSLFLAKTPHCRTSSAKIRFFLCACNLRELQQVS